MDLEKNKTTSLLMERGVSIAQRGHFALAKEKHFFKMTGWFVWCASIVRDDAGVYHLFFSRWPESFGHDGWINRSEIAADSGPLHALRQDRGVR